MLGTCAGYYDEATPVRMVLLLRLEHPFVPRGKIRRTSPCGGVSDNKNIRHIEFESNNVVSAKPYMVIYGIFCCLGALRGAPGVREGCCATPGWLRGRTNRKYLIFG